MAARSIAELLPRPFDQLVIDDVATIVAAAGEEPESLVLELKAELRGDLVAKSCAAFTNTIGGLLVVGVRDDSVELRGIEDEIGESSPGPQVNRGRTWTTTSRSSFGRLSTSTRNASSTQSRASKRGLGALSGSAHAFTRDCDDIGRV